MDTIDHITEAWRFAANAHVGQTVPGTELPYLLHLGLVVAELSEALAADPVLDRRLALCIALLHDTLEDTGTTYSQVLELFGEPVAAGVLALTKNQALPKAERMPDSLQRIRQQPREVWVVKLADRSANMSGPPSFWSEDRRRAYRQEAVRIADELGAASPLLERRLRERIRLYPNHL
ncbi:HD domain-containing protein [Aquabacterium sp. A7-Y]|uniref:HD domain-containing protein n=1 Tax=Aquabacterium sp. A7-Y TaxID=1349605 RepID=UPI00223DA939|nr:HD domain-containing protein [Aquabacterium sp. A7-Y]MCW7538468.1 HD domain-containing protein [Aquabacterium sp. A7-Y]